MINIIVLCLFLALIVVLAIVPFIDNGGGDDNGNI